MVGQPRILFVDDEPHILAAHRRALKNAGFAWQAEFECDPKVALERFAAEPFDVVIADLRMPGLSGVELVTRMGRHAADAAFIILTGMPDLSAAISSINEARVFRFYTKPCSHDVLFDGIASALEPRPMARPPRDALQAIGLSALDRLALGVLVVDRANLVVHSNHQAAALLAERDGICVAPDGTCRAALGDESAELHALIQAAHADEEDLGALALTRKDRRPLAVFLSPLDPDHVTLFISDPECQFVPSTETLSKLYALTEAEAIIAHALASGDILSGAAAKAGLTLESARTYLKRIFSKTHTARQSELVKLVLTAPQTRPGRSGAAS